MTGTDPFGAFLCPEHGGRRECIRKSRRSKERCHAAALAGLRTCRSHSGKRLAKAHVDGLVAQLAAADWVPNGERVDPGEALLDQVAVASRRATFLGRLLAHAYAGDVEGFGETLRGSGLAALVGHRFALDRNGHPVAIEEATRGLARLEAEERDRLARVSKLAIDAGLVAAQTDLLNLLSGQLQAIVDSVLVGLGHDPDDPKVMQVVAERLALAAGPAVVDGGGLGGL